MTQSTLARSNSGAGGVPEPGGSPREEPDAEPAGPVELTILMPCLNEAETLETCVRKALSFLAGEGISGEVLVADNGSTDGSQAIARRAGARVVPVKERGYGAALLGGIAAARGTYVVMGDADDSYDFGGLRPFLDALRNGSDLVVGNRFAGGIAPGAMPFLHRYLGNPVLSLIGRVFFQAPIRDFHCGLRGFRADAIRGLGLQTTGMEFASEMIVRSCLAGQRIAEVPTTLRPDGRSRAPHLKTWRDGWRHLKFLLMYNPKWLFAVPGLCLAVLGLAIALTLFVGPVALVGRVVLDYNAFATGCFLVVVGVQLLTFGALSRNYASASGMLPRGARADWLMRFAKLDRLVVIGAIVLVFGAAAFGLGVREWAKVHFGDLPDPFVPRVVTAGVSLMIIGVQIGFAGFLFGLFEIPLRSRVAAQPGRRE